MSEVEFVNHEVAEAEAARAIGLLNQSDESRVEAWFALQAVADQVGPTSNVGVRGISWSGSRQGERAFYQLQATCVDGNLSTRTGAPDTLVEARDPAQLEPVRQLHARKVAELGGHSQPSRRHRGTGQALVEAVSSTADGRDWVESHKSAETLLLAMVRVADAYGREGIYPLAPIKSHLIFIVHEQRRVLVRQYPEPDRARGMAMKLRGGIAGPSTKRIKVTGRLARKLSNRSGVTLREARMVLQAIADGRSKAQFIRAYNEGSRMVDELDAEDETSAA